MERGRICGYGALQDVVECEESNESRGKRLVRQHIMGEFLKSRVFISRRGRRVKGKSYTISRTLEPMNGRVSEGEKGSYGALSKVVDLKMCG